MAQTIPSQHPAVVLRSHYTHLRILLAIATIAVVGLTVAVVILASNHSAQAGSDAKPYSVQPQTAGRYPVPPETTP